MEISNLFYLSYGLLWVLVLFQSLVLLELVRRAATGTKESGVLHHLAAQDVSPLKGAPAPTLTAPDASTGVAVSSASLFAQRTLLVFVAPNCSGCEAVAGEVEGFRSRRGAQLALMCQGTEEECETWARDHFSGGRVLVDRGGHIAGLFKISSTPSAVLVESGGQTLRYGLPKSVVQVSLGLADLSVPLASASAADRAGAI